MEDAKYRWILQVLHYGLNIGISFEDLTSKDETALTSFLDEFEEPSKPVYNVNIPKQVFEFPENAGKKADIMIYHCLLKMRAQHVELHPSCRIIQMSLIFIVLHQVIKFLKIMQQESSTFQLPEKDFFSIRA